MQMTQGYVTYQTHTLRLLMSLHFLIMIYDNIMLKSRYFGVQIHFILIIHDGKVKFIRYGKVLSTVYMKHILAVRMKYHYPIFSYCLILL